MPMSMFIALRAESPKRRIRGISGFLAEAGQSRPLDDADNQCAAGTKYWLEIVLERCGWSGQRSTTCSMRLLRLTTAAEVFANYIRPAKSVGIDRGAGQLSVLPSSLRIDEFHNTYNGARQNFRTNDDFHSVLNRRFRSFRKWLTANFDHTIIDCPPSLPMQIQLLVKTADAYVVPCIPDKLSVRGSHYLVERLRKKNYKLPRLGTIWTLYREQNEIHRTG